MILKLCPLPYPCWQLVDYCIYEWYVPSFILFFYSNQILLPRLHSDSTNRIYFHIKLSHSLDHFIKCVINSTLVIFGCYIRKGSITFFKNYKKYILTCHEWVCIFFYFIDTIFISWKPRVDLGIEIWSNKISQSGNEINAEENLNRLFVQHVYLYTTTFGRKWDA